MTLCAGLLYLWSTQGSQSVVYQDQTRIKASHPKSDAATFIPDAVKAANQEAPAMPSADQVFNPEWLNHHEPLTEQEAEEYDLVIRQIKNYHSLGKMDQEALHSFRGTVYKYRDRGLAHMGRQLALVTQRTQLQDRESAESLIDQIDALSYFAKASDPLALQIIEDLARRRIEWNADGSMKEPVVNVLTLQAFESFAKHQPDAAVLYLKNQVNPKYRIPYVYYLRMGLKRAGRTEESIGQLVSSL
jgi:hypothetical protein